MSNPELDRERTKARTRADTLDRRQFLSGMAGTGAGLALAGTLSAQAPLFSVSLAEWSLHRDLQSGALDHLDFIVAARRDYGLHAVEYVNQFFADRARDTAYLAEMKSRADGEGVRSLLIMCDGEGRIGDPDERDRTRAVENHYRWIDAARFLGCHSIRVNASSEGNRDEQRARVVDGLRRLAEHADDPGGDRPIDVIVENHGGLSSDAAWLASVMREADHSRVGTLPDFGNFRIADGESYDNYRGVTEMMPWARAVSAKSYDFDESGEEVTLDYGRLVRIVLDAGYRGHIGIEYEGNRLSEPDGIRATLALLERVRDRLAAAYAAS